MNQTWVRNYLEDYFKAHQCEILEKSPAHMTVKLSVEVDKDLTNRPYYWTFVERTGTPPETMTMTFIFDPDQAPDRVHGEVIRFGSERLKQIFHSSKKRGKIVRLFQTTEDTTFKPSSDENNLQILHPWLGVNYKIEWISDKKKEQILSLGINLGTGEMQENFFSIVKNRRLSPVLPPNVSTLSPFITFREAALQLEEWILHEIHQEDFSWAYEAEERLTEEIEQLNRYYDIPEKEQDQPLKDQSLLDVEKKQRIKEIKRQYSPKIIVSPINYGLFYLTEPV